MHKRSQEHGRDASNTMRLLAGLLIGGLAGAGAMLLFAPQSGKRTRAHIQRRSQDLRDQASETMHDAVTQTRVKARQITADIRDQAEDLQQRGQDLFDEQKKRLYTAVEAGKKAVQGSSN